MNKVLFTGRVLGKVFYYPAKEGGGKSVIKFRVSAYEGKNAEGKPYYTTVDCIQFGKSADIINKKQIENKVVYLEAKLTVSNYEDKEGKKRSSTSLLVDPFFDMHDCLYKKKTFENKNDDESSGFYDNTDFLDESTKEEF